MAITQGYKAFIQPIVVMKFGDQSGEDIKQRTSSYVLESSDDKAACLTLVIQDRNLELVDDPRLENNKMITFRLGYPDRMSKERRMVIKEVSPNFPDTGIVTITVKAFDLSVLAKDNTQPKNWGRKKSSEIASEIAQRYGYDSDIESFDDTPSKDRLQPGKMTDMEFLRSLAQRIHYDCYLEGSVLTFKPREFKGSPAHVFAYKSVGVSTLRDFKPNVKSYQPDTHAMTGIDDKTKEKVAGKASDSGKKKSGVRVLSVNGEKLVSKTKIKDGTATPTVTKDADKASRIQPTPETSASKISEALKGSLGLKEERAIDATADLVGTPDIYVRELVKIEGVGRKHSGNYRVASVRHELNESSYHTSIGLRKNALGPSNGSDGTKVPKKDQASKGPPADSAPKKVKVVDANGQTIRTEIRK